MASEKLSAKVQQLGEDVDRVQALSYVIPWER
jgi:hypothetical protein